jgi:hypothetical protein
MESPMPGCHKSRTFDPPPGLPAKHYYELSRDRGDGINQATARLVETWQIVDWETFKPNPTSSRMRRKNLHA